MSKTHGISLTGKEIEKRLSKQGLRTEEIFSEKFNLKREYTVRDLRRLFLSKKDKVTDALLSAVDQNNPFPQTIETTKKVSLDDTYLREIAALLGLDYTACITDYFKETHEKKLSLAKEQKKLYLSPLDKGRVKKKILLEEGAEIRDSDNTVDAEENGDNDKSVDKKAPKTSLKNQLDRLLKTGKMDIALHKKIIRGMSSLSDKGIKHLLILIREEGGLEMIFVEKVLDIIESVTGFSTMAKFLDGMDIKNITTMIHELLPKENAEIIDTVSVSALKSIFGGDKGIRTLNQLLRYNLLPLLNQVDTTKASIFANYMITDTIEIDTLITILNGLSLDSLATLADISSSSRVAETIHTLWSRVETQKLIRIFNGFGGNSVLLDTVLNTVPASKIVYVWEGVESYLIVSIWQDVKKADTTAAFLNALGSDRIIEIYQTFEGHTTLLVDLMNTVEVGRVIAFFKNIDSKILYSHLARQGLKKLVPLYSDVNISLAIGILKDLPARRLDNLMDEIVPEKFLFILKYLDASGDSESVVANLVTLLQTVRIDNLKVFFESIEPSTINRALLTVNGTKLAAILDGLVKDEKVLDVFKLDHEELVSLFWLFKKVNSKSLLAVLNNTNLMRLGSILREIELGMLENIIEKVDDDLLVKVLNDHRARGTLIKELHKLKDKDKQADRFITLANKYAAAFKDNEFVTILSEKGRFPYW